MNKFVKRGCTVLLALTLALGMSVSAFAADAASTATMQKNYKVTNGGTTTPAEAFTFTAKAVSVTDGTKTDGTPLTVADMPALTISSAAYTEGQSGLKDLTISHEKTFPNVGVYTYEVTETAGTTAGVTYNTNNMKLVVTVAHGDGDALVETYNFYPDGTNKGTEIENVYDAGSLTVTKEVTGQLGDKNKKFDITVTFNAPAGKTVKSTITLPDGSQILPTEWKEDTVTKTISLKDGESVEFMNVPYGVTYTVEEKDSQGYQASYDANQNGTIAAATVRTTVTNHNPASPATGVILHSAPYILLLAGVGAAAVAFLILRKHREV